MESVQQQIDLEEYLAAQKTGEMSDRIDLSIDEYIASQTYDAPPYEDTEVHSPSHYNAFDIECIDAIQASMSPIEFQGYCKGNAMKYLWRYTYKGKPMQDLDKGQWYWKRLMESFKGTTEDKGDYDA